MSPPVLKINQKLGSTHSCNSSIRGGWDRRTASLRLEQHSKTLSPFPHPTGYWVPRKMGHPEENGDYVTIHWLDWKNLERQQEARHTSRHSDLDTALLSHSHSLTASGRFLKFGHFFKTLEGASLIHLHYFQWTYWTEFFMPDLIGGSDSLKKWHPWLVSPYTVPFRVQSGHRRQ